MTREEIIIKLKEVFQMVVCNGVNIDLITEESNIKLDLGVNSVGLIYLVVAIEKIFQVNMMNVTVETFKTVGDVITYIYEETNK
jgi:acyl carrier protein